MFKRESISIEEKEAEQLNRGIYKALKRIDGENVGRYIRVRGPWEYSLRRLEADRVKYYQVAFEALREQNIPLGPKFSFNQVVYKIFPGLRESEVIGREKGKSGEIVYSISENKGDFLELMEYLNTLGLDLLEEVFPYPN